MEKDSNLYEKELEEKQLDRKTLSRILKYVKPYKWLLALTIFLLLITAGFEITGPYLIKISIDKYITPQKLQGFLYIVILYGAVIFAEFLIRYLQQYLTEYLGQKIMYDMRMDIFSHIHEMEMSFFDKNPVGRILTRVTTDVQALNEMLSSGIVTLFGDIFMIAGIMIVMISMSIKLSLVTFSVLILLAIAAFIFRAKVRVSFKVIRTKISNMNSFLHEVISGINTVKVFRREYKNEEEFDDLNKGYLTAYIKTILYYAVFFPIVTLISTLAVSLIIWYGGGKVIQNALTLGTLVAFIQYIDKFFNPISDLSEKFGILQEAIAASERIFVLMEQKPSITSPENPLIISREQEKAFELQTGFKSKKAGTSGIPIKGQIEFDKVWFAYENENYVLKDISFVINSGESIAIVGATGSGKTSIINILNRFYDIRKGNIYLNNIDIKKFNLTDLRRHIGIVMQDVFLFSGSILDNIRLGNKDIPFENVVEAAKYVNAHQFIEKLPDKYNQEVKERGQMLSVGQRQLISFARAAVFNPEILLVLDEATSSIDSESEALIQDALIKIMKDRTTIVIAHRLSTIRNADKILVLSHGRIVERGSHQELLKLKGVYYKLYKYQYQLHN
ncbi:MAG: ABC transporter ATP-binding protein/permease [Actinobacteria bacterium]|nr:ABC transporter ATP-binding protein/permease [Actinomycetota bacterium]